MVKKKNEKGISNEINDTIDLTNVSQVDTSVILSTSDVCNNTLKSIQDSLPSTSANIRAQLSKTSEAFMGRNKSIFSPPSSPNPDNNSNLAPINCTSFTVRPAQTSLRKSNNLSVLNSQSTTRTTLPKPLVAAQVKKSIFVSRLSAETSALDVDHHIKSKLSIDSGVTVKKFNFPYNRYISSFKITVFDEFYPSLIDTNFWPSKVLVKDFISKEKLPNNGVSNNINKKSKISSLPKN